jgi:hypothetical protein
MGMRGRSLLAALAAVGLVLLCGGLALPPAYAQDNPAADSNDPNGGGAEPADQQATTPAPAADTPEPAAAPADDAAQPSSETQTASPVDSAAPSPEATPIVASIRAKLQDATLAKSANAQDLAALVTFYGARSDPIWMTDMGFSSEAQAVSTRCARRRLGPPARISNCSRAICRTRWTTRPERDQSRPRHPEICTQRGGKTVPVQLSKPTA